MTCLEIVNNVSPTYVHQFETLKREVYNDNANVHFNQRCLHKNNNNIITNFPKIKVPDTYPVSKFTQHPESITRIKDKIKVLIH